MAMKLQRVAYQNLSAKQKEIYNFQKIAGDWRTMVSTA